MTTIEKIYQHPNADRLDIAVVNAWQVVVRKNSVVPGDVVLYIPPDSVIPPKWSEVWGIREYLKGNDKTRVGSVKLRGEPSHGVAIPVKDHETMSEIVGKYNLGDNLAHEFEITKWEPPVVFQHGDAEQSHPLFHKYTSIENFRNYPNLFSDYECVIITEKLHGTNCRVGMVDGNMVAGSHTLQRKKPDNVKDSIYWLPIADLSICFIKNP